MESEERKQLLLNDHHVRKALLDILRISTRPDALFSDIIQQELRARKNLSAKRRRIIADASYGLIRTDRKVKYLLGIAAAEAGIQPMMLPADDFLLARYFFALIVNEEVHPYEVATGNVPETVARLALSLGDPSARIKAIGEPTRQLAMDASVPDWLAEQISADLGADEAGLILRAMNTRAPLTIRANTLKTTPSELMKTLLQEDVQAEPCALTPWGLQFKKRINVRGLHAFRRGLFETQDEGSQLIALIANPGQNGRVIDLCAGAGGKTLALAAMMQNTGTILATDVSGRRLKRMIPRLRRASIQNVSIHFPDQPIPKQWKRNADVVLVDAPCSGSGTLRRSPEKRNTMSSDDVERLTEIQSEILDNATKWTRKGGHIVYATCSLFSAENEDIIQAFLQRHDNYRQIPLSEHIDPERARSIGDGTVLRVTPHKHNTDAFFGAILQRS